MSNNTVYLAKYLRYYIKYNYNVVKMNKILFINIGIYKNFIILQNSTRKFINKIIRLFNMESNNNKITIEEFATFCKKKGFVFQAAEIYGGLAGIYDYGHLGFTLKQNFCNLWRKHFLNLSDDFVEIDASNIMPEGVFKASGHLENFFDPIVKIEGEEKTYRADHLIEDNLGMRAEELSNEEMLKIIIENKLLGDINYNKVEIENLNMMFPVDMGPKKATKAYLRPETAQGPFVNFKIQHEILRKKMPIGLAMIGKAYRNEISPRNLLLRTRELEQAELQIFFNPEKIEKHENFDNIKNYELIIMFENKRDENLQKITAEELSKTLPEFYVYHMVMIQKFYLEILKINEKHFRFYQLNDDEKAFYNKIHFDIEVYFDSLNSWVENGGCHYRTDHDLKGHQEESKISHEVFDEETKQRFIPHVLELSFGVGRNVQYLLDHFYNNNKERGNIVLNFPQKLAPYKVAIFPLMNKPELTNLAKEIYNELIDEEINVIYDKSGSIGKRYARQDEIGTPYCLTIDYEAIEEGELKNTITIRDRDSTEQKRINVKEISAYIKLMLREDLEFKDIK